MSCNQQIEVTQRILCAVTCTEQFNTPPVASLAFTGGSLVDTSTYNDNGGLGRKIKWSIYVGDYLVYEIGYGESSDTVFELTNGSTYENLIVGDNNQDIIDLLNSQPNTIVPNNTVFNIFISVKDNTGVENTTKSNKYTFTS